MHLERFEVDNLGPIKHAELPLARNFNAIVGINGSGKSTLLNSLALMLGRYASVIRTGRVSGTVFDRTQIKRGARFTRVTVTALDNARSQDPIIWSMGVSRPGRKEIAKLTNSSSLIVYGTGIAREIEISPYEATLPLVVYYPVHRAVLDIPLRVRGTVPFEPVGALDGSLSQQGRSFREFFSWFRQREDLENENRLEGSTERDPELTAVRQAIAGMLPGFENLKVKRSPLRMLITKKGIELRVDELSDGEKSMLALAGDLARRLASANPGLSNPLHGQAVVLVDELELHLHPAWQRRTVTQLQETFPNCQFIVSTHSPQVVSEVAADGVFLLRDGMIERTDQSKGRSSNLILKELMEVQSRPDWADADIKILYETIDEERYVEAQALLDDLVIKLGGDDPGLTAARALLVATFPR